MQIKKFLATLVLFTAITQNLFAACSDGGVLLLHGNGADGSTTITDSSDAPHTVTVGGDAQIDTAESKFGGSSFLFDGTGDYLTSADSADWDLGSGDYTVDFWVRYAATSGERILLDRNVTADITIRTDAGVNFEVWQESSLRIQTSTSFPTTGTWFHFAIVRSSGTVTYYKDGTSIATSGSSTQDIQGTAAIFIGARSDATGYFSGWIDEFRIIKGTAVWTGNFTPPTSEYCASRRRIMVVS